MSIIYKNSNGDTRTAPKNVTFKEFQKANDMHKQDVKIVMDELKHTFKPELINRIDEIIVFKSLSRNIVYNILDKIISDVEFRLSDKNIKLKLSDSAKEKIINDSYDVTFGARPIKRYVSRNIENLIANYLILDKIKINSEITIDFINNEFIIK